MSSVLKTLLPKLATLLQKEYKLQKRVRGEIMFLKAELESMEVALLQLSETPIDNQPDRETRLWARKVRELSYDLEDTIDKFMVRSENGTSNLYTFKGFIERTINLLTKIKIRHQLGTETKEIKRCIMQLSERRYRYKVDNVAAKPVVPPISSLHLEALYRKETELIGIEKKSNDLIKKLTEENKASQEQSKIISIVGFGGLGKTTMANVVYKKLKSEFDCGAFVSVSRNPNMEKIFKNMLFQLDSDKYKRIDEATWDEARLINEVREFLLHKRYLIVVDDIWHIFVWERIRYALVDNGGNRIITTTRNMDIAENIGGIYQIEPLSQVDARKLFNLKVNGIAEKCPPDELLAISQKILKKCGGFPLAIITIASMLSSKRGIESTHTYWSKVYHCMGSGLKDNPDLMKMRTILSISYHDLPAHLKNCLLFLCSCLEDCCISANKLIWDWVAQGFVSKEDGRSLYKVGEDYVTQLINRSFIQSEDFYTGEKARMHFTVHDMVFDLITYLSQEDNFLITFDGHPPMSLPEKVHRLVIRSSMHGDIKKFGTLNLVNLRSLIVSEEAFHFLPDLSEFSILRYLDLSYCRQVDTRCFQIICNLHHLRGLRLLRTSITKVPKEIRNLRFLQILDIGLNFYMDRQLPPTFIELQQLVFLNTPYKTELPDGFENLELLQELRSVLIRSASMLHNLGKLTELRSLSIRFETSDDNYIDPLHQCFSNLTCLESLELEVPGSIDLGWHHMSPAPILQQLQTLVLSSECGITAAPAWLAPLCSLSVLKIFLETLGETDLQVLGSIPSLRSLSMMVDEPTHGRDRKLVIENGHKFLRLKVFRINCGSLEIEFAPGAMEKLEKLRISFRMEETMAQFGGLTIGAENLSSLVEVGVRLIVSESSLPDEVKAAEDTICGAISMNPNKPLLNVEVIRRN